jgi:hypothetical protein
MQFTPPDSSSWAGPYRWRSMIGNSLNWESLNAGVKRPVVHNRMRVAEERGSLGGLGQAQALAASSELSLRS